MTKQFCQLYGQKKLSKSPIISHKESNEDKADLNLQSEYDRH